VDFMKPILKESTKDTLQVKLHTTSDQRSQVIISWELGADSVKGAVLSSIDIWDHIKLEFDVDFDQTPANPTSEILGVQVKAKGSVPRDVIDQYQKQTKSDPFLSRLIKLFQSGKFNLRLLPIDQILPQLFGESKEKKKKKKAQTRRPKGLFLPCY